MNSVHPSQPGAPGLLATTLREHRWLGLVVGLYAGVAFALCLAFPANYQIVAVFEGFLTTSLFGAVFGLCGYTIYVMVMLRPDRLTHFLYTSLRAYLNRARLLHALPVLLMLPVFASSFTIVKSAVPLLHPYAWDANLAAWDQALHGGVAPWLWLQPLLGHPYVTGLVNFFYNLWFFILYAILYRVALDMNQRQLRMQLLLSFVLSWILLGSVLAIVLSSVGPCFYGHLDLGADPYAPLMTYLHESNRQVPVWALQLQGILWESYQNQRQGQGAAIGISAMPSMHVATAVLLALWGRRTNRRAGTALSVFALLIMIGSVHLGWHYALDGYVGAAGAYAVWRMVGALQTRAWRDASVDNTRAVPQGVCLHVAGGPHEH